MDKILSRLSPSREKKKMAFVVGKIHGKIWNQGIPCPTNKFQENPV